MTLKGSRLAGPYWLSLRVAASSQCYTFPSTILGVCPDFVPQCRNVIHPRRGPGWSAKRIVLFMIVKPRSAAVPVRDEI
jgi:hypothetical protein